MKESAPDRRAPTRALRANRHRVGLAVLLVVLLGSISTSIAGFASARGSLRSGLLRDELPLTGDSVYSEVQRDLLRPVSISEQMAHDTFLQTWVASGERDESEMIRYLQAIQKSSEATTAFFISEATRAYYHPSGILKTIDLNDPADAWYARARAIREPYEINVDTDTADRKRTTVFVNYRVVDPSGRLLGITGVGLTLNLIRGRVETYGREFGRRITFYDRNGKPTLQANDAGTDVRLQNRAGASTIAAQILSGRGESQQLKYEREGERVLVNARYLPELGWYLVVEQPEGPRLRSIRDSLYTNIAIGTAIAGLTAAMLMAVIKRLQRHLVRAATTDELTSLTNRQAGKEMLDAVVTANTKRGLVVSLLLVDADHFKAINDAHGHSVGDAVLVGIADALRASCRRDDLVIRWGGEEFVAALPGCDLADALGVAAALQGVLTVRSGAFTDRPAVTVSIGVATARPDESAATLLIRADEALYLAKASGRNCIRTDRDVSSKDDVPAASALEPFGT